MANATIGFGGRLLGVLAFAVTGVAFAGCGDDGGAKVNVTLGEFIVEPDPTSEDAGEIEFVGDNGGGETHELVVVRAANADELPTDADGAVDEAQLPDGALIGEIEDIEAGMSKSVTLDLEAGSYVLFCNITEEEDTGEVESHFAEGMHSDFEVE
jgi:hypothetical protein